MEAINVNRIFTALEFNREPKIIGRCNGNHTNKWLHKKLLEVTKSKYSELEYDFKMVYDNTIFGGYLNVNYKVSGANKVSIVIR